MSRRNYRSEGRKAKARETRRQILLSAKQLLQEKGFEDLTVAELAQSAGVSASTIYTLFQSKRGVVAALIDEALPSEAFEELVRAGAQEPCPTKRLQITANLCRRLYEAEHSLMDLLRGASLIASELRDLEEKREHRRYARQSEFVQTLADENVLADSLDVTKARDVLWVFTGRDLYRLFVLERGWTADAYEAWLAEQLTRLLLRQS